MDDNTAGSVYLMSEVPQAADRLLIAPQQRHPIVTVLGMHHSGTLLCSHVLSALGVDMTDKAAGPGGESPTPDNPRGNCVPLRIAEFHDRILDIFNRKYRGSFHDFSLPVAWWTDPRVTEARRALTAVLETRMGNGYFGFGDPRTMRLMPIWHQIANELGLAPKIVYCLRNPAQVVRALHAREGIGLGFGEYRWLSYTADFFYHTKSSDFCTIEYETWFDDPIRNLTKLQNFLNLPAYHDELDIRLAISELIDKELRPDDRWIGEARHPLIRLFYDLARRASHDPAARDQVRELAAQFLTFQQLLRPFQSEFQETVALTAKLPALEQEAADLRSLLGEREAELERASGKGKESSARESELRAELDRQRSDVADLARERDGAVAALGEHAQVIEAMQIELAGLRDALTETERDNAALELIWNQLDNLQNAVEQFEEEANARAATILTMHNDIAEIRRAVYEKEQETQKAAGALQSEVSQLRDRLAQAEREVQGRDAVAGGLREEIASLRDKLAQTEREVQERDAVAGGLREEIGGLRGRLAQAVRERTVASDAAAVQIVALEKALTTARQVGRAALDALAATPVVIGSREPPLGWRQALRRWFGI